MSSRWPGSLINKTAPTSSGGGVQDSAPGVWTLDQANPYIANGTWPGTGTPDPQFQYVTALLHGDGVNAAQNNTFLDSSSNNFTITRNGNTTQGSFSPYGSLWSNYFNGSSSLAAPAISAYNLGTNNFTAECWFNPTISGQTGVFFGQWYSLSGSNRSFTFYIDSSNYLNALFGYGSSSTINFTSSVVTTINSWNHAALVRNGNVFTLYLNGSSVATATQSVTGIASTLTLNIGSDGAYPYTGYVSNARLVNGTALYTSNFTPSTTPLTAVTNTVYLSAQSNRFIDNSSNNATLTVSGSPSVQRFSPFQNLATYQTAKIGGSGYFDGNGDYLTIPASSSFNDFGTGDFTIECWFYANGTSGYGLAGTPTFNTSGWILLLNNSATGIPSFMPVPFSNEIQSTVAYKPYTWNHFAVTRASGTVKLWLNGALVQTATYTGSISNSNGLAIGQAGAGWDARYYYNGYMTDLRIVKGTAVYTTAFTPPTTPLTNITNTSVLTNYTNGAIYDNAAMNNLETVGSAQISTSVVKYGTGSMYFAGTGNYLQSNTAQSNNVTFGTGNFTIEFWLYLTSVSSAQVIYDTRPASTTGAYNMIYCSSGVITYNTNNADQITGSTLSTNTWYHIAVCRVGGYTRMYVNGNQVGSTYTDSTNYIVGANRPVIGANGYDLTSYNLTGGYVDDLRITKGYARYWFNFQPPSAPYPNYGGTLQLTYDPYFYSNTLLLNGEGTNGAQNNTFLDSSTNNFTITRNGNTAQGSFSPYGSLWGNYFNGTNSELTCTGSALSGQFTMEGWICYTSSFANGTTYFGISSNNGGFVRQETSSTITFLNAGVSIDLTGSFTPVIGQWYHIAVTRNASNLMTIWVNGSSVGSATVSYSYASGTFAIGANHYSGGTTGYFPGYISNVRLVTGSCLYTANFTPSTTPLTAISGTQVLTCQSNRFVDNSSNAYAITVNGTTTVQRFSPFNPTAPYSTSVIGGSGYFDGSTAYLNTATVSNFGLGTGDFCLEAWVYATTSQSDCHIVDCVNGSTGIILRVNSSNQLEAYLGGYGAVTYAIGFILNSWHHVSVTRSGTSVRLFLDGAIVATATTGQDLGSSLPATVGGQISASRYWNGYICDARIVKGSAVYTSAFTPPTAPITAITNTQLLTNMTNAGIPDLAMQNNLQTVGSAQVSTSVKKYGTGSIYLPGGSGDILSMPSIKPMILSGDFTIEFWINANTTSKGGLICGNWGDSAPGLLYSHPSYPNKVSMWLNGAAVSFAGSTTMSTGTWYHIALTRVGNLFTLYMNGISQVSSTQTFTVTDPERFIGAEGGTNDFFNGYIDDLRITKGLARYVQNFTPPTAALPTY